MLKLLEEHNLTSLPVMSKGKFSGFVDLMDLLSLLVETATSKKVCSLVCSLYFLQNTQMESFVTGPSQSLHTDDVSMIFDRSNQFKLHSIREQSAKNKSHHDPSCVVALSDPISAAIKHFVQGGLHRLAVVDSHGQLVNVLTQSDLLAWASKDISARVDSASFVNAEAIMSPAFSIQDSLCAIDAFCMLESRHFAGAPVVDKVCLYVCSSQKIYHLKRTGFWLVA